MADEYIITKGIVTDPIAGRDEQNSAGYVEGLKEKGLSHLQVSFGGAMEVFGGKFGAAKFPYGYTKQAGELIGKELVVKVCLNPETDSPVVSEIIEP